MVVRQKAIKKQLVPLIHLVPSVENATILLRRGEDVGATADFFHSKADICTVLRVRDTIPDVFILPT